MESSLFGLLPATVKGQVWTTELELRQPHLAENLHWGRENKPVTNSTVS